MKKFVFVLLFVSGVFASSVWAGPSGEFAFVDMQEVFKRFYKTLLAQDQLRQQDADIKLETDTMAQQIKKKREEVELLRVDSRNKKLSKEIRENKIQQMETKLVELQKLNQEMSNYQKLRTEQLNQQKQRMIRKLFDEITAKINEYAKEQGYTAVIDSSAKGATGTLLVLYVDNKNNITDEVLARLNEENKNKKKEN
jgi:Skp family chaperone for outer membrane proteins